MVIALDRALRERVFQRVADWSTDRYGVSCYALAAAAAVAALAAWCAVTGVKAATRGLDWPDALFLLSWLIITAWGYARAGRLERRWRADPMLPPPPPEAIEYAVRIFWLGISSLQATVVVLAIWRSHPDTVSLVCNFTNAAAFLAHLYFLACLPRLPRTRRAPALAMVSS